MGYRQDTEKPIEGAVHRGVARYRERDHSLFRISLGRAAFSARITLLQTYDFHNVLFSRLGMYRLADDSKNEGLNWVIGHHSETCDAVLAMRANRALLREDR